MESSIGVNLRVTAHSNQGGRKYMEDMFCVAYQPTMDERDLMYAYFGIFDGHGGREAAEYAKNHLMDNIVAQKNFWEDDDKLILKAIRDGFIHTHYSMWREHHKWPKTPSGLPSTSGTTASIAFVRRSKLYMGHVGDSAIVLGYQDPASGYWRAKPLTKDHKPESIIESTRIHNSGGKVVNKSGVPRVVWNRPRVGHRGPIRRSTPIDEIPFLAVARSLGDLWSYNSSQDEFVVSPEPDVSVEEIDVNSYRCLILGSDGLWNMLNAQEAVNSVYFAEKNNERQLLASPPDVASSQVKNWINPSKRLVDRSLDRWYQHNLRADNTTVVAVVIDPPGPPKAQVLRQNQKNHQFVRQSVTSSVTDPYTARTIPAMVLATGSPTKPITSATQPGFPKPQPVNPKNVVHPIVQHNAESPDVRTVSVPDQTIVKCSEQVAAKHNKKHAKAGLTQKTKQHQSSNQLISHALETENTHKQTTSSNSTSKRSNLKRKSDSRAQQSHVQNDSATVELATTPIIGNDGCTESVQIHEISSSSEKESLRKMRLKYRKGGLLGRESTQTRSLETTPRTRLSAAAKPGFENVREPAVKKRRLTGISRKTTKNQIVEQNCDLEIQKESSTKEGISKIKISRRGKHTKKSMVSSSIRPTIQKRKRTKSATSSGKSSSSFNGKRNLRSSQKSPETVVTVPVPTHKIHTSPVKKEVKRPVTRVTRSMAHV